MKTIQKLRNAAVKAENIDDIIFEGRNTEYGAYALRKEYNNHLMLSLLAAIAFVSLAAGIPFLRAILNPPIIQIKLPPEIIDVEFENLMNQILPPPPVEVLLPPSLVSGTEFLAPVVVDEVIGETTTFDGAEFYQPDPPVEKGNLEYYPTDPSDAIPAEDTMVYDKFEVKEQAIFMGGNEENFRIWLVKNIRYPADAVDNKINGRITLKFAVNKEGTVCDVKVIRGIHSTIDEAAVEAVLKSPKWIPAKIDGYPVKVFYYVPIFFDLQN